MIDINDLLSGLSLIFCTVGPILMIIGILLHKELFPATNIVSWIEDIPQKEGLYNVVGVGKYYLVYWETGYWYRVRTDSKGKVHLSNPKRF